MATAAETKEDMTVATKKRYKGKEADTILTMVSALIVSVCHIMTMSWHGYYN